MKLGGMSIQLGLRCPLECSHCYISAGPLKKEAISRRILEEAIIGYAKDSNRAPILAFTGGDPFAMRELLYIGYDLGYDLGLDVYVTTSGFFAKTHESALLVLNKLKNLSQLEVSVDSFHQSFVSDKNITNIYNAARELGIPIQFAVQEEEWCDKNSLTRVLIEPLLEDGNSTLYKQDFQYVGERNLRVKPESLEYGHQGCKKISTIVVDEAGHVYPCCSAVMMSQRYKIGSRPPLSRGNLNLESFEEIIKKIREDEILRYIKIIGADATNQLLEMVTPQKNEHPCIVCTRINAIENLHDYTKKLDIRDIEMIINA